MNYRLIVLGMVLLGVLVPSVLALDKWEYSAPGTYNWTCPADMTNATLKIIGGGGGGRAGSTVGGAYYSGEGGKAGGNTTINRIAVVPNQNYTFVIGAGGANSTYGNVSNSGTYSAMFGLNMPGGAGGLVIPASGAGGAGEAGQFTATTYAQAGTGHSPIAGGAGGAGFGAGGGGGSSDGVDTNTIGGFGSAGYVGVFRYGTSGLNAPDFTGSPLTGTSGTLVRFTDTSSIVSAAGLTYNWSFGDGVYSTTAGSVSHVYPYLGSFDVSLTLTNGSSTSNTERKEAYVNLVSESQDLDMTTGTDAVQFTIVDKYGRALKNVAVSSQMISTSLNGTNWWDTIFKTDASATPMNTTILNDTTDDSGSVVFYMTSTGKYRITFLNASQGVSDSKTVHPILQNYIYILSSTATAAATNMENSINMTLWTSPPASTNPATIYLIGNYTDASASTSNVTFYVNATNMTTLYSVSRTNSTPFNNQYAVTNTAGTGYVWGIKTSTTAFGNVSKAMGLTLKGTGANGLASNLLAVCNNWECT